MLKQIVRAPLRAMGVDVVRWSPPNPSAQPQVIYAPTCWIEKYTIRTVLDIGANEGNFASVMAQRFSDARIYSFEPLSDMFAHFIAATAACRASRCRAFNVALGVENGSTQIHRSPYAPSSSLLKMAELHKDAFPNTAGPEIVEEIKIRRLDDMAGEMDLQDGIFIKIDVQGFELKVVAGGRNTISRAAAVIIETCFAPLYEGQPIFDDVYQVMKGLGFRYMGNWEQLEHPQTRQILCADAIFFEAVSCGAVPRSARPLIRSSPRRGTRPCPRRRLIRGFILICLFLQPAPPQRRRPRILRLVLGPGIELDF